MTRRLNGITFGANTIFTNGYYQATNASTNTSRLLFLITGGRLRISNYFIMSTPTRASDNNVTPRRRTHRTGILHRSRITHLRTFSGNGINTINTRTRIRHHSPGTTSHILNVTQIITTGIPFRILHTITNSGGNSTHPPHTIGQLTHSQTNIYVGGRHS